MKKIISLTKVLFRNNKNDPEKMNKKSKIFLYLGLGVYILIVFMNFWNLYIEPLKSIGRPELSISFILNVVNMFIFMTSITYVANILYFTNDMEKILPFPFKPKEIFASKLLTIYLYQLVVVLMFLVPGFLAYGKSLNQGIIFYIYALVISLLVPIIPLVCITAIYTVLAQFIKFTKYKNLFKIISTVVLLAVIVIFQINMNNNMTDNGSYSSEYIFEITKQMNNNSPYFIKVAVNSLTKTTLLSSTVSLIWYIIINLLMFIITIFAFNKLYIKGVCNNLDGVTKKRGDGKKRIVKPKTKLKALIYKDIKNLFRNVTYFIQCVMPVFFMPIVLLAMSMNTITESSLEGIGQSITLKLIICLTIIQFFMLINYTSVTAVSRDGKNEATFMKTLPIRNEELINAKAKPSIFLGIINLIIALIFVNKIFALDTVVTIILVVCGILLNNIQSYLFILIDLKKPKLNFESEIAVVKQNMNIFKAIILWFTIIIITSVVGSLFAEYNVIYFIIFYVNILAIIYIILRFYIKKRSKSLFDRIQ